MTVITNNNMNHTKPLDIDQLSNVIKNIHIQNKKIIVMCSYYPFIDTKQDNIYTPQKLSQNDVVCFQKEMIQQKYEKYEYSMEELYFRNLVKLTINEIHIQYMKKTSTLINLEKGFAIITYFDPINNSQFPNINKYHLMTTNNHIVFNNNGCYDVMLKSNNSNYTFCVNFNTNIQNLDNTLLSISNLCNHISKKNIFK